MFTKIFLIKFINFYDNFFFEKKEEPPTSCLEPRTPSFTFWRAIHSAIEAHWKKRQIDRHLKHILDSIITNLIIFMPNKKLWQKY